jgi:hypothetical protein
MVLAKARARTNPRSMEAWSLSKLTNLNESNREFLNLNNLGTDFSRGES